MVKYKKKPLKFKQKKFIKSYTGSAECEESKIKLWGHGFLKNQKSFRSSQNLTSSPKGRVQVELYYFIVLLPMKGAM